jgi:hypothetical protein
MCGILRDIIRSSTGDRRRQQAEATMVEWAVTIGDDASSPSVTATACYCALAPPHLNSRRKF